MDYSGQLIKLIDSIGCQYTLGAPMREYTSFRVGGPAEILAEPSDKHQLARLITAAKELKVPVLILGNGSNLLVRDSGIEGLVIRTSGLNSIEYDGDRTVKCGSGVILSRLCNFALDKSLSGLEFAFGIPGTAGGAAYMNAGAYGGEMKDVLVSCEHVTPDGEFAVFSGDELMLSYRSSAYASGDYAVTSLTLKLEKAPPDGIRAKMDDLLSRRKAKQPLEYPSAGSTFKRPEGHFAGALIEQCGLKGFSVGGAQVSEKHAGFVINKGGATADDILRLMDHVSSVVFAETGVSLEPEVKII